MNDSAEKQTKIRGFTLIEVLIVLTVVAVLGGIIFPFGKRVFQRARIEEDKTKLSMLALTYVSDLKTESLGDAIDPREGMVSFARAWAKKGGPDTLDAYQSDKRTGRSAAVSLLDETITLKQEDFDFIAVYPIPKNAPLNEMPAFYTRGLQDDGNWSEDSLYGTEGGLVAFADGEVRALKNAKKAFSAWLKCLGF